MNLRLRKRRPDRIWLLGIRLILEDGIFNRCRNLIFPTHGVPFERIVCWTKSERRRHSPSLTATDSCCRLIDRDEAHTQEQPSFWRIVLPAPIAKRSEILRSYLDSIALLAFEILGNRLIATMLVGPGVSYGPRLSSTETANPLALTAMVVTGEVLPGWRSVRGSEVLDELNRLNVEFIRLARRLPG